MHILDDSTTSVRVARFLAARGERWESTSVEQIRLSATANGPDGPRPSVPDALVEAAIAFEERYGGLAYRPGPAENHMEYGLDGEASFYWTPEYGWTLPALIDGSWTWMLAVLPDGRTIMGPGEWPDRIIDRTVEQRLEKHALLAEVATWPHATFAYVTGPQVVPDLEVSDLRPVQEATGPADRWWYDGESAIHLTLIGWPEAEDRWLLRCFARTMDQLPDVLRRVRHSGPIDHGVWCSICCRFLQPSYSPQGEPGYCLPSPSDR